MIAKISNSLNIKANTGKNVDITKYKYLIYIYIYNKTAFLSCFKLNQSRM